MLPRKFMAARASIIRFYLFATSGHIVRHARQLTVMVSQAKWTIIDQAIGRYETIHFSDNLAANEAA